MLIMKWEMRRVVLYRLRSILIFQIYPMVLMHQYSIKKRIQTKKENIFYSIKRLAHASRILILVLVPLSGCRPKLPVAALSLAHPIQMIRIVS